MNFRNWKLPTIETLLKLQDLENRAKQPQTDEVLKARIQKDLRKLREFLK